MGEPDLTPGSPAWAAETELAPIEDMARAALEEAGKTVVVVVTADGLALGLLALRDEPRADAAAGVATLKALAPGRKAG